MKLTVFWFAATLALVVPAVAQTSILSEAQRAYLTGDYDVAKAKFRVILAQDPSNRVAANYLRMIAVAQAKNGTGVSMEKQLKELVVTVDFKEATFEAALDYLKQTADRLSDGKVKPSFVVQPGVDRVAPITLRLSNIPFTEVLRYMGELAKVDFRIERFAITVQPKSFAPPLNQ